MELTPQDLIQLVALYIVFLFSVTFHEAAHSFAAKWMGDPTAAVSGQATLNPMPHIQRSPWGMVLLPIVGLLFWGFPIGFASAPYAIDWALKYPRRAGLMALAGPVSNLLLTLVAAVAIVAFFRTGLAFPSREFSITNFAVGSNDATDAIMMFLEGFFSLNLLLAILNILPFPPLDGSAVLSLFLGNFHGRRYQMFLINSPWIAFIGLLIVLNFVDRLFAPAYVWSIGWLFRLGFGMN